MPPPDETVGDILGLDYVHNYSYISWMKTPYPDITGIDFVPLFEARAQLSEQIKKTQKQRRIAVTINGRPAAVILSYQDYLDLLKQLQKPSLAEEPIIDFKKWKQGSRQRKLVSQSIDKLFDVEKLSRKGQKSYKRDTVRGFSRNS